MHVRQQTIQWKAILRIMNVFRKCAFMKYVFSCEEKGLQLLRPS